MRNAASTISKEERIDLDDLENFAQMFKKQRIKFGDYIFLFLIILVKHLVEIQYDIYFRTNSQVNGIFK